MPNRTFVILGPDMGDVPSHWDRQQWQWVEGAAGDKPSPSCVYTAAVLDFPPAELPTGVGCIVDISTGKQWTPCMGEGENRI